MVFLFKIFFEVLILIIAIHFLIKFLGNSINKISEYHKQFDNYSENEKKEAKNEIKRKLLKNLLLKTLIYVITIVCIIRYSLFLEYNYTGSYDPLNLLKMSFNMISQTISIGIIGLIIYGINLFKSEEKETSEILRKIYLFNLIVTIILLYFTKYFVYFFI